MMLFVALALIFVVVAATRPGEGRMFRGLYRRDRLVHGQSDGANGRAPDPTMGLRDPSRRL